MTYYIQAAKMEGSDRERKRRISAELEPQQGEEQEEDVIGPMPAESARGIKKRKGELLNGGKFEYCSN